MEPRKAPVRKKSYAKGEMEKVASAKRPEFGKAEIEKPVLAFDAEKLLYSLLKPWELGGHSHEFLRWHRCSRTTDPYQHYEKNEFLLKRHHKMVAEKEAWNRQRELREDMIHLLTRLHSIEHERRHFIDKRKENHADEEAANIKLGALSLANTFFQKKSNFAALNPIKGKSRDAPTAPASIGQEEPPVVQALHPSSIAARKEVEELEAFDAKLEAPVDPKKKRGSAVSFPKKKK